MTNNSPTTTYRQKVFLGLSVIFGLLLFMFSIDFLTYTLTMLNNEVANNIFRATHNPFVGLFIGLLMTALIQSSSTVSAMVVAVVAAGQISLSQAVPLIMGANIGTTLTSTLVAFGYIMKKKEFRKALSAGVLHDFFNIITVLILLPLEVYFNVLGNMSQFLTQTFFMDQNRFDKDYVYQGFFLRPLTVYIYTLLNQPFVAIAAGILMLVVSIRILSSLAYKSLISPKFKKVSKHIFKLPIRSFAYGMFFTAAVQSSTITTSLMVTIVATGRVALKRVFPFIIGANIGTTITAAIAALYKTEAAISVAVVHLLFNSIGALIFLPFPAIRSIPVFLANVFGKKTVQTRLVGFAYILLTFFIIPFFLIYFNKSDQPKHAMNGQPLAIQEVGRIEKNNDKSTLVF